MKIIRGNEEFDKYINRSDIYNLENLYVDGLSDYYFTTGVRAINCIFKNCSFSASGGVELYVGGEVKFVNCSMGRIECFQSYDDKAKRLSFINCDMYKVYCVDSIPITVVSSRLEHVSLSKKSRFVGCDIKLFIVDDMYYWGQNIINSCRIEAIQFKDMMLDCDNDLDRGIFERIIGYSAKNSKVILKGVSAFRAFAVGLDFSNFSFFDTYFTRSRFKDCNFSKSNRISRDLHDDQIYGSEDQDICFEHCDLSGTDFGDAEIEKMSEDLGIYVYFKKGGK